MVAKLTFNTEIAKDKPENIVHDHDYCPFCHPETLENILKQDGECIWLMNKFRTLEDTAQTVLVEDADHDGDISKYSKTKNRHVINFALDCWNEMLMNKDYKSVAMYKNFGPLSGGSILHPHMQIVGFNNVDINSEIIEKNFIGVPVFDNESVQVNISTFPIMSFVEINIKLKDTNTDLFADMIHDTTMYLLNDYMNGRCTSYNIFFYKIVGELIAKVIPRFVTSPYFIGYRVTQVDTTKRLQEIGDELIKRFSN